MLKSLDIPMTAAGQNLILPKEIEKAAYVLYRETDEGLVFVGLYDPDVPDEDYCDGVYKIPFRSTYVKTEPLHENITTLYNVKGSSSDKTFVIGGETHNVHSWIGIWEQLMVSLGLTPTVRKCYVKKQGDDDPCNTGTRIVGGHMTTEPSGEIRTRDDVYLVPICQTHNNVNNTDAMEITEDVNAIVMQYMYNGIPAQVHTETVRSQGIQSIGIDVSEHNGIVDFERVKKTGFNFVMIREGYGNELLYPSQLDQCFIKNYENAKKSGMMVGAYHYLYATTPQIAVSEAQAFVKNLRGKQFEMPIALDIEDKCQSKLSKAVIGNIITVFMDICEKAGYYCVLYSYESFLNNQVPEKLLTRYDVWCANTVSSPKITCGMHQHSFKGRVSGVNTDVDLNYAFKDYPTIIKEKGLNGFPKTTS